MIDLTDFVPGIRIRFSVCGFAIRRDPSSFERGVMIRGGWYLSWYFWHADTLHAGFWPKVTASKHPASVTSDAQSDFSNHQ